MVNKEAKIKWLHAPGHSGSVDAKVVDRAFRSHALVIDWTEMYHNVSSLKHLCPDYNHFVGSPRRKDSRNRVVNHDVVISTHSSAKIVYDEEFFVDDQLGFNLKYHPTRYGKARVVEYQGVRILIVAWHPQPGALHNLKIVLPHYRRSVARVSDVIHRLTLVHKPDLVLAGGDLQLGRGNKAFFPNKLAERLGLASANNKIDWQMWSESWDVAESHLIDPSKINPNMDHMWMERILHRH